VVAKFRENAALSLAAADSAALERTVDALEHQTDLEVLGQLLARASA
jgi:hypothetical protein